MRCGSATHVLYLVCGLVAALSYYPLIAYLQPQLQFKSKSLDLKFEPTYLGTSSTNKTKLSGGRELLVRGPNLGGAARA